MKSAWWNSQHSGSILSPVSASIGSTEVIGFSYHSWLIVATATLVAVSLAIMVAAGSLFALSERAAHDLLDPSSYVRAVLG